jgi:DNA mismatch endonuclease (patch repair protein)
MGPSVPDHLSPAGRSRNMAAIRSKDTKPELLARRELYRRGVRGWRCHTKTIPGKPDVAFTRWKVAVFIDGAFWHGHPDHFTPGRSGVHWDAKISRTQERDRLANEALGVQGWTVLRFWDFEVNENVGRCVEAIMVALDESGRPRSK